MPKTALESKRIDIEQLQLERNELAKQQTADIERIIADHKYRDLNEMPSEVASQRTQVINKLDSQLQRLIFELEDLQVQSLDNYRHLNSEKEIDEMTASEFSADLRYQELLIQMQDLVSSDEAHDLFVLTNAEFKISHNTMTLFESKMAQSTVVFNSESATSLAREYLTPLVCHMTLANLEQTHNVYSHIAIIDSGTNMHILHQTLFADRTYEEHSLVASFSGKTSRSTLRGDLSCTVLTENKQMLHLHNTDSAIVVPDTVRNLLSVHQLQKAGHTITLGSKRAGIQINSSHEHFVPFSLCPTTGLWLIHLLPPAAATTRVYSIPATVLNASTDLDRSKLAYSHTSELDDQDADSIDTRLSDHQKLGHPSFKRMPLDIEGINIIPPGREMKTISCPVCIASKMCKPNRPIASIDITVTEPWTDIYTDLSGKIRTRSITGMKYFVVFSYT